MTSSTTPSFWRAFQSLPDQIKDEARKASSFGVLTRVIRQFASGGKERTGLFASLEVGEPWQRNMRACSSGSGLAHMMSTSECSAGETLTQTATSDQVAYPEGYRTWAHIKSTMIGPTHKNFATLGAYTARLVE